MFAERLTPCRLVERSSAVADAERLLRLDHYLPDYDAVSRRHVVVDAPPDETYDAALAADLTRLGAVVNAFGAVRAAPGRVAAWVQGTPVSEPASFTFGDLPTRGDWVRLEGVRGEEFVFGAVGKIWQLDIEWAELSGEEFRGFDRPGYAKIAAGLSFRPYGRTRTLVTYEARTAGTDPVSTWRFKQYWRLVRPFVGYVLSRVLVRVKADASASSRGVSHREDEARREHE